MRTDSMIHALAVVTVHAKYLESFRKAIPVNPVVGMNASSGAVSEDVSSEVRAIISDMIQRQE